MKQCSKEKCDKVVWANGLCHTHDSYARFDAEPLYRSWVAMKQRCYNPKSKAFKHYGGRGISVCPQWVKSFAQFKKDIGTRPSPKHSMDRINNNGNYEPGNMRWSTQFEQALNQRTRKDNKLGVRGVMYDKQRGQFRSHIVTNGKQKFLGRFDTLDEAITARQAAQAKYFPK